MSLRFAAASVLAFALTSPAYALSANEAGLGDFSGSSGTATAVGTLDLGLNTISGTINSQGLLAGDAADFFRFDVDPGMLVASVIVSISSYSENGNPNGIARDPLASNVADFSIGSIGVSPELLLGPFGAGSFVFELSDTTGLGLFNNLAFSYTVSMTTVPEPSAGLLLGAALVALGVRRRTR